MMWPFRFLWKLFRFFLLAGIALIAFFFFFFIFLPNVAYLRTHNPEKTRFMELYLEKIKGEGGEAVIDHHWVPYSHISSALKQAVLVSEDDTFFYHHGFDWKQIREAVKTNWKKKRFARGGSTITQQLVKNLYLGPGKNPFRKIREVIITYQMEHTLTKQRIFEIYLNVIEWGPGVYGAEAASRYYFGTSAQNLGAQQAAFLAAILPNPVRFGSKGYSRRVSRKVGLILSRMHAPVATEETSSPPPQEEILAPKLPPIEEMSPEETTPEGTSSDPRMEL